VDFENFDRSTRRIVIKDTDRKPTGVPRKRIKVGPVLFEDRPMCMLVVPVYEVTLAVAAVVIVWIDFPYDVFDVLLIQRTIWIDPSVYENAVPIDIDQR
jgi:hypothetical protein